MLWHIEAKLNKSYKDWFNIDGSYYALPHAAGAGVISYDKDIFEANDCYLDKNGNFVSNYKNRKNDANKNEWIGTGPDGEVGTYDDGLPVTYADFEMIMMPAYHRLYEKVRKNSFMQKDTLMVILTEDEKKVSHISFRYKEKNDVWED